MDSSEIGLNVAMAMMGNFILMKANPAISDFFTSNFVIFVLVAVFTHKISKDKNILVSIASAFFAVILVKIMTMKDFNEILEPFEIIYPGPNSSPNCLKVTKAELVSSIGTETKLKQVMAESGVPYNMELNDVNSPEIATYISNNPNFGKINACELIVKEKKL